MSNNNSYYLFSNTMTNLKTRIPKSNENALLSDKLYMLSNLDKTILASSGVVKQSSSAL